MVRIDLDEKLVSGDTKPADLPKILAMQRAAFNAHTNPSFEERRDNLKKLGKAIDDNASAFQQAISQDFGNRSFHETTIAELTVIAGGISHSLKHLRQWMRNRARPTQLQFMPGKNVLIAQPLGVVGIISPWNYPLQLAIMPLIGALAAGNRVMIKPSEYTPRLSKLLKSVLGSIFKEDEIYVATGGVEVASAFSSLPLDHILFTGSTSVGRIVAKAAAGNLTPLTLELGGKSPAIIDDSANMEITVPRLLVGKLLNAGQTCVAPDYVMMPESRIADFSERLIKKAEEFYPTFAGNEQYTSIIADSHYARLQDLIDDAESKGARVRVAGTDDKQQLAKERRIPLTIVTHTTPDMRIMQEEIFGPLLPILPSETLDDSMDYMQKHDRPLAAYWFGEDKKKREHFLKNSISGGVSINEAAWHVVQEDLPFGGVGPSGMGAYHGEDGFKTFSHMKGVFIQSKFSGGKMLAPPYGPKTDKLLALMKRLA